MPRVWYRAVLAIGFVCVIALAGYRWHVSHPAHDPAPRVLSRPAASPNARQSRQPVQATVILAQPSAAPDVLSVRLRPGLRVRYLVNMPDMPGMGTSTFDTAADAGGSVYSGTIVFPMAGRTRVVVQVLSHGAWQPVQTLLYRVDEHGIAHAAPTVM